MSTLRMAVEGMGGRLEVTAVFDIERIPLTTHSRTAHREGGEGLALSWRRPREPSDRQSADSLPDCPVKHGPASSALGGGRKGAASSIA